MSVDTKLFIETNDKDIRTILSIVDDALSKLFSNTANNSIPYCTINSLKGEYFSIHFKYKGEPRSIFVALDCDIDYTAVSLAPKIIFSLGCWGSASEIMIAIGQEFANHYLMQ